MSTAPHPPHPAALPGHRRPLRRVGFTLVEILIVVVILGVLAAIALPQFSSASESARANSTLSMLKTLRAQLELYKVHHNEQYPPLEDLWDNLMETTDEHGNIDPDGGFGPYLQKPPINPYTQRTDIVAIDEGTLADGWEYDEQTGEVRAVGFDEKTLTYTRPGGEGGETESES